MRTWLWCARSTSPTATATATTMAATTATRVASRMWMLLVPGTVVRERVMECQRVVGSRGWRRAPPAEGKAVGTDAAAVEAVEG